MAEITCDKCGHQWQSRTPNPIKCPRCQHLRRKTLPAILRFKVLTRDNFTCVKCGFSNAEGIGLQAHHIVPQSQNGKSVIENLETLCVSCHDEKHRVGKTKFYKSRTYSWSVEVVEAFDRAQAEGVSPNQLVKRLLGLNGDETSDEPPARELLVELDGDEG